MKVWLYKGDILPSDEQAQEEELDELGSIEVTLPADVPLEEEISATEETQDQPDNQDTEDVTAEEN